jgi:hypothetical protein
MALKLCQGELVKMAFKVFNNWEEARDHCKAKLLAAALRPPPLSSKRAGQCMPPGACFKCNQMGHCAKNCPSPCALPGPCPQCGQNGHWRVNCPSLPPQGRSVSHPHSHQTKGLMDLLGLVAKDWHSPGTSFHWPWILRWTDLFAPYWAVGWQKSWEYFAH